MRPTPLELLCAALTEDFGCSTPLAPTYRTEFQAGLSYTTREAGVPLTLNIGAKWDTRSREIQLAAYIEENSFPAWEGVKEYFEAFNWHIRPYMTSFISTEGLCVELLPYSVEPGGSELVGLYAGLYCYRGKGRQYIQDKFREHLSFYYRALYICRPVFESLSAGERPEQGALAQILKREAHRLDFLDSPVLEEDAEDEDEDEEEERAIPVRVN